jgi:hypothetical protein
VEVGIYLLVDTLPCTKLDLLDSTTFVLTFVLKIHRPRNFYIILVGKACVIVTRDRCYDFLNIFAEKIGEKIGVLTQNKAKLCKILIITLVFVKNANFFAENLEKSQTIVIITFAPDLVNFNNLAIASFGH